VNNHLNVVIFPGNYSLDRLIRGDGTCVVCGEFLGNIVYQGPKCPMCFRNQADNNIPKDVAQEYPVDLDEYEDSDKEYVTYFCPHCEHQIWICQDTGDGAEVECTDCRHRYTAGDVRNWTSNEAAEIAFRRMTIRDTRDTAAWYTLRDWLKETKS